jgi:DNA-binding transcriptional MocR family regulator
MQLSLDREADSPIYRQIVDQIRAHIGAGTLPPGSRLPPVRKLAAEYGLTRLTAHSAYEELQAQGLVEAHVGRGTFVAAGAPRVPVPEPPPVPPIPWRNQGLLAELARAGEPRDALSFAQAFPAPETYPARELGRALRLALDEPGVLGYGSTQGEPELRRQLAGLLADRGLSVSPESVLVTAGAQQAIDVVLRGSSTPG